MAQEKVNEVDENGSTPLHMAAWEGATEVVRALLEKGAKVDAVDKDGRTPLHMAAREGKTEAVRALLEKGAKVDAVDKDGRTPLHDADGRGFHAIAGLLRKAASQGAGKGR